MWFDMVGWLVNIPWFLVGGHVLHSFHRGWGGHVLHSPQGLCSRSSLEGCSPNLCSPNQVIEGGRHTQCLCTDSCFLSLAKRKNSIHLSISPPPLKYIAVPKHNMLFQYMFCLTALQKQHLASVQSCKHPSCATSRKGVTLW